MNIERDKDVEQLRRIALVQQKQIKSLLGVLKTKCAEIEELKGDGGDLQQTLDLLNRITAEAHKPVVGSSDGEQPQKESRRPAASGHGPTPQTEVPRTEELFELEDSERACPSCGGTLTPLKGQCETSEMVDVVEVSYRLVTVHRQKYGCKCGSHIETAPGPERAVERGRYSLAFASKVAVDKYVDHLPLARQTRIMARHGLIVTSQTLWDQLEALSSLLKPAYDALHCAVLSESVIGLDQTGWPRLNQKGAKPWQMWCLTTTDVIYHRICEDKSTNAWNDLLGDYNGVVVCDAMSTHSARGRNKPCPMLAGCWAHVLRKFREAEPDFPEANIPLELIGELYEIDRRARSPAELANLRRTESTVVIGKLYAWIMGQPALKTTSIGNAIHYTFATWDRLTRFVDNPQIPLDNNRTERAIRSPVVGRKNHYGSKSARGTKVAAIFYSLIETAKLRGINPATYLAQAAEAARAGVTLLPIAAID